MHHTKERNPLAGIKARKVRDPSAALAAFEEQMHQTALDMDRPAGQRLSFWLGQASREMREEAGVRTEQIALQVGHGKEMVDRFERGQTRPQDLEGLLVVYAQTLGVPDAREIAVRALRMWFEHGEAPSLNQLDEGDAPREGAEPSASPADPSLPPSSLDEVEPPSHVGEEQR